MEIKTKDFYDDVKISILLITQKVMFMVHR